MSYLSAYACGAAAVSAALLRVTTLPGGADAAARLNRAIAMSTLDMIPGLREYANWFMLANVNHYYRSVELVFENLAFVRACFESVANLEPDIALARHLLGVPFFCRSSTSCGPIDLQDTFHPLLEQAQPLSIRLTGKGAFISGQNGIGKSTLLRTVGLSLVTARAFGFCYARHASVPDVPAYTSIQSEDSLMGGESLYMAELRRAKELLASANGPHPGVCIIGGGLSARRAGSKRRCHRVVAQSGAGRFAGAPARATVRGKGGERRLDNCRPGCWRTPTVSRC